MFSDDIWSFRLSGFIAIASGVVFYLRCAWDFATTGKGTPAPIDPPKTLISGGLYRIVRNPMYVGIVLILIGESIVFESWTLVQFTFLMWLIFHLFVVLYEEPYLKRNFGVPYEEYCQTVRRWIPRLNRFRGG
ncbi:MAG: isoprenylcysteine carboxylmethyltransferase family protein [Bacteroidota bacterium]